MVFDFLKRGGAALEPEVKASATARVIAMASGGGVAWSPRDSVSLTRNGFLANPVAFRAV